MSNAATRRLYKSERIIWSLISEEPEQVCKGVLHYKAKAQFSELKEANKFVIEDEFNVAALKQALLKYEPHRLRIAPTYGRSLARQDLLELCTENVLITPTGDSCLYLFSSDEHRFEISRLPRGYTVSKFNSTNSQYVYFMVDLHLRKYQNTTAEVRAAVAEWTIGRTSIGGFEGVLMFLAGSPIGCLGSFPTDGFTRLRDLFVLPEYRGNGLSKHLLLRTMEATGPFGVITSTNNIAKRAYLKRELRPVYLQEAYEVSFLKS